MLGNFGVYQYTSILMGAGIWSRSKFKTQEKHWFLAKDMPRYAQMSKCIQNEITGTPNTSLRK